MTFALEAARKLPLPELPLGRVLHEKSAAADPSYLWVRGDFRRRGPEVAPAFLRVVNFTDETVAHPTDDAPTSGRRTALARWLTRPDNPLTARVLVNRLWQWHFGRGLAELPSDFGVMGYEPTHPELLDWLATELTRTGGSLKHMHRLLVTSAVYRQASHPASDTWNIEQRQIANVRWQAAHERDPFNRLWSRMERRRLEGEAIRDAMLSVGAELNGKHGGPGVRPPLPQELVATLLDKQWPVTEDASEHRRRSIYLFVRRNLRFPLFEAFDRPDTNASCPRRSESTIAPQALMLLNSELSLDSARRLAGYVWSHAGANTTVQVDLCYARVLSRQPTAEERQWSLEFLANAAARLQSESRTTDQLALPEPFPTDADRYQGAALTDLCLALFNLNEFVYVD